MWADGKLYVTEVNGRIHILRADRQGCQALHHVHLTAADGNGDDEIYASPAISEGRIVWVTRDRTICVAHAQAQPVDPAIPPMLEETAAEEAVAVIQLRPAKR